MALSPGGRKRRIRDGDSEVTEGTGQQSPQRHRGTETHRGTGIGPHAVRCTPPWSAAAGLRPATLAVSVSEDPSRAGVDIGLDPHSRSLPAARRAAQRTEG